MRDYAVQVDITKVYQVHVNATDEESAASLVENMDAVQIEDEGELLEVWTDVADVEED